MPDIYEQHRAAFRQVSAYVVCDNGERVATIAFKFPADGAGRLYAYAHWFGLEMTRGHAGGGGYDKQSAALSGAARKAIEDYGRAHEPATQAIERRRQFFLAILRDAGLSWDRELRERGFTVFQAV